MCPVSPVLAQVVGFGVEEADTQLWLQYAYQRKIAEKWSLTTDLGYRDLWQSPTSNEGWDRWHFRGNFSYRQHPRLNFELGSGVFHTPRPSDVADLSEIRTRQGMTVFWPDSPDRVRRFVLAHRLRLEQRFTTQSGEDDWDYASRARYRMSTKIALNRKELEVGAFYTFLSAELFAPIDKDSSRLLTDRKRLTVGLGWVISPQWDAELRYVRQENKDTISRNFELSDNIVEFRVRTQIRIRDRMKEH